MTLEIMVPKASTHSSLHRVVFVPVLVLWNLSYFSVLKIMHIYLIIKKDLIFSTATARGLQEASKHTQVKEVYRPFPSWRHFTTTTRML